MHTCAPHTHHKQSTHAHAQVLHGADHDVLWLQRDFHLYLVNMFDTGQVSFPSQPTCGFSCCALLRGAPCATEAWSILPATSSWRPGSALLLQHFEARTGRPAAAARGTVPQGLAYGARMCLLYHPDRVSLLHDQASHRVSHRVDVMRQTSAPKSALAIAQPAVQATRVLSYPSNSLAFLLEHFCGVKADKRFQVVLPACVYTQCSGAHLCGPSCRMHAHACMA